MPNSPSFAKPARESAPLSPEGMLCDGTSRGAKGVNISFPPSNEARRREHGAFPKGNGFCKGFARREREGMAFAALVRGSERRQRLIPSGECDPSGFSRAARRRRISLLPLREARKAGNAVFPRGKEAFIRLREARKGEMQDLDKREHLSRAPWDKPV